MFTRALEIVAGGTTQGKAPNTLIPGEYPIYAARAQGSHLWDVDDNHFLDWILAYGTIVLGYCDPDVDAAAIREIREGFSLPLTKPVQNELAELLTDLIPCAETVHFFKCGSDTTTAAVRLARIFTGRDKIVRWGYNGSKHTLAFNSGTASLHTALFAGGADRVVLRPTAAPAKVMLSEIEKIAAWACG